MTKVFLDVECYKNYFLICFKNYETANTRYFELHSDSSLDLTAIRTIMTKFTTLGFNSKNYDLPMIAYALNGANNEQLKTLSDAIINSEEPSWEVVKKFKVQVPWEWDHIDILPPAPAPGVGLKMYGARMHTKKLQDLPIEPDALISIEDRDLLREYCFNDLEITIDLYNAIKDRVDLRVEMSKTHGIDLRSKSDAQIAEAVIKKSLGIGKFTNTLNPDAKYRYKAPEFIEFKSEELNELLNKICSYDFKCDQGGNLINPDFLNESHITIGGKTYTVGIGGLHSNDDSCATIASDNELLIDADVTSYYPSIILNNNYYPEAIGEGFLDVYRSIYTSRIEAKKAGDKIKADSYKIILNGSFGKFGSRYSVLYSPQLLLSTTLTGQLSLLMLIEMASDKGFDVISANTDGITIKTNQDKAVTLYFTKDYWQQLTNFNLEYSYYKAVYHESVNSYIAIKDDGKVKTKGYYAETGLMKNPDAQICVNAVIAYLQRKTPLEETIKSCNDIRQFLIARRVKDGATWKGQYLGKVVRWYYSTEGDYILTSTSGNKVANSIGAKPMMTLLDEFPSDLDYQKYIDDANKMLVSLGVK